MNQEDADFTTQNSETPDYQEAIRQLARSLSETLIKNYKWIRFIAIAEVIVVLLDLILSFGTTLINPMALIHSLLGIISAYYLWHLYKEIKHAYSCEDLEAVKKSFQLIGKYFITSTLAFIFQIAS